MASLEEMASVSPDAVSPEDLTAEMAACEKEVEDCSFSAPMDEVFTLPDPHRTTFLWQVLAKPEQGELEEWEKEDENWVCLPSMWQSILSRRLAEYHARVQDAEAFYLHRSDKFGSEDIKTKNAKSKFENAQEWAGFHQRNLDRQKHSERGIARSLPEGCEKQRWRLDSFCHKPHCGLQIGCQQHDPDNH